jgi:hypothetical protein
MAFTIPSIPNFKLPFAVLDKCISRITFNKMGRHMKRAFEYGSTEIYQ